MTTKRKTAPPPPAAPAVPMLYRCPSCKSIRYSKGPITGGMTCDRCAVAGLGAVEMAGEEQR